VSDAIKRKAAERKEDRKGEIFIESGREFKYLCRRSIGENGTELSRSIYGEG